MRKNQSNLSNNEWDDIIDAMKCLKKSKKEKNWDYFVDKHDKYSTHQHDGPHVNGEDLHIHSSYYWLAWHRKFILDFEEALKNEGMTNDLPYWNWITTREIPKELKKRLFGWMNVSRAVSHNPDKLPTRSTFDAIVNSTVYASFDLELNNLHGIVHNWVGGAMSNPRKSPKDPLFFLHHAFIDKTWADWQAKNPTRNFESDMLEAELTPYDTLKVRDVMNINNLGYSYI